MIEKSVLICGRSGTGKSYSLRNLRNPEGVMYLNCEGKSLPFPNKFQKFDVTEPMQVYEALTAVNDMSDVHTVVIDSATFLMDMFETQIVNNSSNTQKAWGDYASFIKDLCLIYLKKCTKNVVITSHVTNFYNSDLLVNETRAGIKGSVGKGNGFESYFTNVIYTKTMPLEKLKAKHPDRVHIVKAESVPFGQYCQMMDESQVLLDQLYSYTPAMNALLAMSKGIVVVGGGEEEHYRLLGESELRPIVNVQPSEASVMEEIEQRILARRDDLARLSRESIEYVRRHHDHIRVAERYLEAWSCGLARRRPDDN